jgi:two-component system cell cycle sensor histidine kinase/response regulator CckA
MLIIEGRHILPFSPLSQILNELQHVIGIIVECNIPDEIPRGDTTDVIKNNATILLVDDEEHIREMMTEYLEESGYRVYATSNGLEALELFRKHHESIDLVITDLGMPKMGGEELYRKLKKIDGTVTVMVSSGYLDGSTKEHLLSLGIKDVLTKPSKLHEIQHAVNAALGSISTL